ncbi:MAG: TIGR04282 family arsenosugar biosynthesis glycosyltransferase [Caldimicrobium sp.]|jgi:rSAM/selenodomain-associated transferase 1
MEDLKALVLFFKIPERKKVKSRLAKNLGEEMALTIYEDLLLKTVKTCEKFSKTSNVRLFAFYAGEKIEKIKKFFDFSLKWRFINQEGEGLGERLKRAGDFLFSIGFKVIVIIGADCPFIDEAYLDEAFAMLEEYPLVIGPSRDGGYVLIGFNDNMKKRLSIIFDNLPFETSKLFEETLKRISKNKIHLLPTLFDIDTPEDYRKFTQIYKKLT